MMMNLDMSLGIQREEKFVLILNKSPRFVPSGRK